MNLRGALFGYCRSAAHICKDGICTSVCGTRGVDCTTGVEYLAFSSLIGAFLCPGDFIGWRYLIWRIFPCNRCALVQFSVSLLFLLVHNLWKIVLLQQRLRKIWNHFAAISLIKFYMSVFLSGTHFWWHCPFNYLYVSITLCLSGFTTMQPISPHTHSPGIRIIPCWADYYQIITPVFLFDYSKTANYPHQTFLIRFERILLFFRDFEPVFSSSFL
jgi:hypothetical protein